MKKKKTTTNKQTNKLQSCTAAEQKPPQNSLALLFDKCNIIGCATLSIEDVARSV
jgi:hypothetical protein